MEWKKNEVPFGEGQLGWSKSDFLENRQKKEGTEGEQLVRGEEIREQTKKDLHSQHRNDHERRFRGIRLKQRRKNIERGEGENNNGGGI